MSTQTIEQVLDRHGIQINRSKNIHCPVHDDSNPSCRVNEDYVYCFSCGWSADAAGLEAAITNTKIDDVLRSWGTSSGPKPTIPTIPKANKHQMMMELYSQWVVISQERMNTVLAHLPQWLHETAKEQIWDVYDTVVGMRRISSPAVFSDLCRSAIDAVENWADHWLAVKQPDE